MADGPSPPGAAGSYPSSSSTNWRPQRPPFRGGRGRGRARGSKSWHNPRHPRPPRHPIKDTKSFIRPTFPRIHGSPLNRKQKKSAITNHRQLVPMSLI
ncbi:hypothetical protein DM01DRAFT_1148142 [Hesseltinella vesiculosa]|uniref:Uncharacterized protein n=1 Tax=Hesseltinella vesiculosa TaxID=101127 RepID=A0A1X2G740_9FUNG|nr:hypothetical protein DM01DRAFT_1148142 [Hesseltinella vesiculosa]